MRAAEPSSTMRSTSRTPDFLVRKLKNCAWSTVCCIPVGSKPISVITVSLNAASTGLRSLSFINFSFKPSFSCARVRNCIAAETSPASSAALALVIRSVYWFIRFVPTARTPWITSSPHPIPGIRLDGSKKTAAKASTVPDATVQAHDSSEITPTSANALATPRPGVHAKLSSPRVTSPRISPCRRSCVSLTSPPTK